MTRTFLVAMLALTACSAQVSSGSTDGDPDQGGADSSGGGAPEPPLPEGVSWMHLIDFENHQRDEAFAVAVAADGSLVVHGVETLSPGGGSVRSALLRVDEQGYERLPDPHEGMMGLDVAVSGETIVAGGAGVVEVGNPGFFVAWSDTGSISESAFDVGDVSIAFGEGAYALAVARGGETALRFEFPASEPLWSVVEPTGGARGVAVTPSGTVLLAGERYEEGDAIGSFIAAYANGERSWLVVDEPQGALPAAIAAAPDGAFYVAGTKLSSPLDSFVAGYDANGSLLWVTEHEDEEGWDLVTTSIAVAPNGDLVVCGTVSLDRGFVRRLRSDGALLWHRDVAIEWSGQEPLLNLWDVAVAPSGEIAVVGGLLVDAARHRDMLVMLMDP